MKAAKKNTRLVEERLNHKWTQQEVADRIGTTPGNINRWEQGKSIPGPHFRRALLELFGRSEQDLGLVPGDVSVASQRTAPVYDPTIPSEGTPIGRTPLLQMLKNSLQQGGSGMRCSLYGLPGVGKTTLASMLANDAEVRQWYPDGILWAGLGPFPTFSRLLGRWGTLLGISSEQMATLSSNEAWAVTLCTAIGERRMLLVIDDAWKLEDALSFQVGGPNCAYVITTRSLDIAFQFAPGGEMKVEELNEDESIRLLFNLAPEVTRREYSDMKTLVQSVGGLPLALTLIGKFLHLQAHSGSPRRIHNALERLKRVEERLRLAQPIAPLERSSGLSWSVSLQATIELSDQQLSPQGHKALRSLAVFPAKPNTFSEEAAVAICGDSVDALDELSDAGMLEHRGPDRYCLHQVISDYARTNLRDTTAYDRLIAFLQQYVEQHAKDYELLEQESSNILAALEAAHILERNAELVHSVCAFTPFLLSRSLYELAELQLQRASEVVAQGRVADRIYILLYQGQMAQKQGNYAQAEAEFKEGLALARQLCDPSQVSLLADLGWVTWKQGHYSQAETYLQEGLTLARHADDKEQISNILKVFGSVKAAFGDYATETSYLIEGVALARSLGDRGRLCVLLNNLGAAYLSQGNYPQAKNSLQEALALARQIGHYEWISLALLNLSAASGNEHHHYSDGKAFSEEGLALARQIGHREWTSIHLTNLGIIAREEGNYSQAETYLEEGLALMQQVGRPSAISEILYEYAILRLLQGSAEVAEALLNQMKATIPEGDQMLTALWQYGMAQLAAKGGKGEMARQLGEASQATLAKTGDYRKSEVEEWLARLAKQSSGEGETQIIY